MIKHCKLLNEILFFQVGQQYEKENEGDFKDKQDFQVWDRNAGVEGCYDEKLAGANDLINETFTCC